MTVETAELWRRFHDEGDKEARKEIIARYYPLAQRITARMLRALPAHADADDITSFGTIGLIRAVDNFRTDAGVRFETFAVPSIRGLVLDELRSMDWAPRSLRKAQRTVLRATEALEFELNRMPSDDEIAVRSEMSLGEVRSVKYRVDTSHWKSLDETFSSTEDGDTSDRYASQAIRQSSPDEEHAVSQMYVMAVDKIKQLTYQEQAVLVLYYYSFLKFGQIGQILGLPENKVSAIHTRAVLELRTHLAEHLKA